MHKNRITHVRSLVLTDVANLHGSPDVDVSTSGLIRDTLSSMLTDLGSSRWLVGMSHRTAKAAAFAWSGALLRLRSGPGGVDGALIEAIGDETLVGVNTVVVASGSSGFVPTAIRLRKEGIRTIAVARPDSIASSLRLVVDQYRPFPPFPRTSELLEITDLMAA